MWRFLFLLLSYFISASAYAISLGELPAHEPNPELVQAESLLKTDPEQALEQLNLFIDKPDRSLTASDSVRNLNLQYLQQRRENMFQALLLKSQAQNKTGNVRGALKTLDYVTQLAKNHNNAYIQAKAILLQAKYHWGQSGNPQEAVQTLARSGIELNLPHLSAAVQMQYQLLMAAVYLESVSPSHQKGSIPQIQNYLQTAHNLLNKVSDPRLKIEYYLLESRLNALLRHRNATQEALMTAMGLAIAYREDDLVADAQLQLANFYVTYGGYSIALNYVSRAASFYEKVGEKSNLASALRLIGHIHSYEDRPNLALVNYLNAIDVAHSIPNSGKLIDIKLGIAFVYLQLNELKKANTYIDQAEKIINSERRFAALHPVYMLLKGEYLLRNDKINPALSIIQNGIKEIPADDLNLRKYAYSLMIQAYQKNGNRNQENAYLQDKVKLLEQIRSQQLEFNTETLLQHEQLIDKINANHELQSSYTSLEQHYTHSRNLNKFLLCSILLAVIAICYFLMVTTGYRAALRRNRKMGFSHPRTNLANQRKLNATLPGYLQGTVRLCEQAICGEQTHMLDDNPFKGSRLKVALFRLNWLAELRLRPDFSYQAIVKLENELGEYLHTTLGGRGQLFHLNDSGFLYVEPSDVSPSPEEFTEHLLLTCEQFPQYKAPAGQISIGACHYPLLPRALSGVQLPELLNVLQLAQTAAAQLNQQYDQNHWVMLLPIPTATPACFQGDLYVACLDAIRRGLIKVAHSDTPNPVDWVTLLAQYSSPAHTPARLATVGE
ncbi:tetratricopeptide repeat protein [Plesiomonas shigelloides]|uniref:tetratricopeptide repeat protein n=1 Tax=Plesiomonas shigelloides TaxID=703 RepID=UPI001C5ACDD8|nr:hypothetical protein [Plesiomonas shigelloides]MBW3791996.1 hypothetical protein [Plesiomonas shigelloides]